MAIEKLTEFAKDGQKDLKDLSLTDGFPLKIKPARQWFNWIFNALTLKINEIIDKKLDIDGTVLQATQLEKPCIFRLYGAVTGESTPFNGRSDVNILVSGLRADQLEGVATISTLGNANTATNLERDRIIEFMGDVSGGFTFGHLENISCELQLLDRHGANITAPLSESAFPIITINSRGIVTSLEERPMPAASINRPGIVLLAHNASTSESSITKALSQYGANEIKRRIPGLEQAWKPVDRAMNTVYTNLNARPITIMITAYRCTVRVSGTGSSLGFSTVGDESTCLSFLVPYGASYEILPREIIVVDGQPDDWQGAKIIECAELS